MWGAIRGARAGLALGLLVAMATTACRAQATVTYGYDPLGRVLSAADSGDSTCVIYNYDAAGNRTLYKSSADGPPIANPFTISTPANTAVTFDPRVNDTSPSCSALSISSVGTPTAPAHGTIPTWSATSIQYQPNANFVGADHFSYGITDAQGRPASNTVTVNVQLVAVTASVTPVTWNWMESASGVITEDPPVTVTASGGLTPYAFSWQFVSGSTIMSPTNPSSSSTQWSGSPAQNNVSYTALWRCQVTDHAGTIAYTGNVTVTATAFNNN